MFTKNTATQKSTNKLTYYLGNSKLPFCNCYYKDRNVRKDFLHIEARIPAVEHLLLPSKIGVEKFPAAIKMPINPYTRDTTVPLKKKKRTPLGWPFILSVSEGLKTHFPA